jgi:hypothetical protein
MSDLGSTTIPAPRETVMRIRDTQFSLWRHTIPPGRDRRVAFDREYWATTAYKFRAGDRVEVVTHDYRRQFVIVILGINTSVDPAFISWDFIPLYPVDLPLPKPDVQRAPAFVARPSPGSSGLFDVVRSADGELMRPSLQLLEAERQAANLDAAAKTAEEQMASAAVAHFTKPATPEPPPVKSKAAARTAAWRAKQRAMKEGAADEHSSAA